MESNGRFVTRRWVSMVICFSLGLLFCAPGQASIQFLDLTTNGAAGLALDSHVPFVFEGVTLTASSTSTIGTSEVNANAESLGVNIIGNGGDIASEVDLSFGEQLFFTLTFGSPISLTLVSLDLDGVGPTTPGDDAYIYLNGGLLTDLYTGASGFNGTTDVWTPAGGISLASGDSLSFVAGRSFGLDGITFEVNAVPEAVSFCVWFLGIAICLGRRQAR